MKSHSRGRLTLTLLGALAIAHLGPLAGGGRVAHAQDPEALARVKDLNKKAVDSYENLDLEEARKSLMQALELCASEGLNRHPLKATTHLNLGVVLMGGLKEKDAAIKQFRRALEIDPNIKVPRRLSNPEIQGAFDAAVKEAASGEPVAAEKPAAPTAPPEAPGEAKPAGAGLPASAVIHDPVTDAKPGQPIPLHAKIDPSLRFDRVVLAYRPEGASDFLARDMDKDASGEFSASIPDVATSGGSVAYYIEARGRGGQAVARNGTPDEPHVVTLNAGGAPVAQVETGEEPEGEAPKARSSKDPTGHFWFGFGLGTGGGWIKGSPEVNRNYLDSAGKAVPIDVDTFASAKLLHFLPEVGYYLTPHLTLSLQGRLQITTGATEVHHPSCKPSGVCKPATGAIGVLARATWLFDLTETIHPFVSLSAGGGYIRYLVDLSDLMLTGCGPSGNDNCYDTVAGGGFLVGPGAGIWFEAASSFYVTGTVNALLGVPNTAFNVDLNLGLAYRL